MSPSRKLKGEENYSAWKNDMMNTAMASSLERFRVKDPTKPKEIKNDNKRNRSTILERVADG